VAALEKGARLGELAGDIMRHPFLGKALALKGGSALNLCLGPPKRLSVDLDFNYTGHAEREKMLEERPLIEAALIELASGSFECRNPRRHLPGASFISVIGQFLDLRTGLKWT
jgi:predicted nucleotidyltransferase component of viral defense system